MNKEKTVVVCGAGGFIGGHMVRDLQERGFKSIRAVDRKPLEAWYQCFDGVENLCLDLGDKEACLTSLEGAGTVFNLACDMGGMGFIENNKALCMLSVLINTHLLMAAKEHGVEKFFYASSACVYAADKQVDPENPGLKESDAYPAMPEDGYGWEKLFSERMCRHFYEDYGVDCRIVRFHNVYGPWGTYDGGREKAPAAICRKVISAKLTGDPQLEIWGDGEQTRSFMYIDDCLEGVMKIMDAEIREPINLGSDEMVTINQLVDLAEEFGGIKLDRQHNLDAPKGVRGRNSENTLIKSYLGWAPEVSLRTGLGKTYGWIEEQMSKSSDEAAAAAKHFAS